MSIGHHDNIPVMEVPAYGSCDEIVEEAQRCLRT